MADRNYRLIVEGELSHALEFAFPGMTLTRAAGNTALTGNIRDQAELHGLPRRLSNLGLTLLEARAIDHPTASQEMDPPMQTRDRHLVDQGGWS